MSNRNHTTLMEVCVNPKLKQTVYKPLDDCIIGYDDKGYHKMSTTCQLIF